VAEVCEVYKHAPERHQAGERTVSTDELTGVQALERRHPGLPMAPGQVERRKFEYVRHGTGSFILSRDVVTGKLLAPSAGDTRTETDFLTHVQAMMVTDSTARRWHFVLDNPGHTLTLRAGPDHVQVLAWRVARIVITI
jgi:hypothetical protein